MPGRGTSQAWSRNRERPFAPALKGLYSDALTRTSLALRNCRVFGHPKADSILIRGERIAEVGTGLTAELEVRLSGAFVIPGFNDAHIHFARGAQELSALGLAGARSPEEMQQRIRDRLPEFGPGEWITGHGWDHTLWGGAASAESGGPETPWPGRRLLDEVSEQHPMYFSRVDMHVALASTRALEAAGLMQKARPDPPGGAVARDRDGLPTGLLKETAMELVRSVIPAADREARKAAIVRALRVATRFGITSLQDNSYWDDYLLYRELEREGRLTARITEWLDFTEPIEELERKRRQEATRASALLRLGLVKGFADGSLGSRTAALLAPYHDAPAGDRGLPRFSPEALREKVVALDAAGFQIGLHAIGDAAVRLCLDTFEHAAARNAPPSAGRRHRIEHSQVVADADLPRYGALGLVASVQPNHWLTDSRWAAARLGSERLPTAYRWASFARLGVPLALGTDFPVEPMDPRRVLYAAATREGPERLSMEDAVRFYTAGSAFAEFAESEKGAIAPGMLADLAVLADDPCAMHPDTVLKLETVMTFVGGEQVF